MKQRPRIKITSIETAVQIYYTFPELGTDEVIQLFGCSKATATRLKKRARDRQIREGIITFSDANVNTKTAYKEWGLDIADLERRMVRYRRIQEGMAT